MMFKAALTPQVLFDFIFAKKKKMLLPWKNVGSVLICFPQCAIIK